MVIFCTGFVPFLPAFFAFFLFLLLFFDCHLSFLILMVETGHWSGGGTSNHPEVPVESSAMLMRNQKLWMRRPNYFYEINEYGLNVM